MTDEELKKRKRKNIAEDGEIVRLPLTLMDEASRDLAATVDRILRPQVPFMHKPGFAPVGDAERLRRERLYRDHDKNLSERWKNSAQQANYSETIQSTGDTKLDAYVRYERRLSNAWRHR